MQSFLEHFAKTVDAKTLGHGLGTKTASKEDSDVNTHGSMKTITESKESLDYSSLHFGTMTKSTEQQDVL